MEYVAEYQQVARDYDLSPSQRFQYLRNLLRGDAMRLYLDKVQPYATSFTHAVDQVSAEYNSIAPQNRVKNYLKSYRMRTLMAEGMTETAALEQTYKTITKLAPQVPLSYQGDEHKVELLRKAVIGSPWATEPLSRIATNQLTFQQLYGELEAALPVRLHRDLWLHNRCPAFYSPVKGSMRDATPAPTSVARRTLVDIRDPAGSTRSPSWAVSTSTVRAAS